MRRPMIAGNWKMYMETDAARSLVTDLNRLIEGLSGVEVLVCPPFTALSEIAGLLAGLNGKIILGAQNVYFEKEGAFTGEISPLMLKDLKVKYCIVGHSERRQIFGETDEMVNKKTKALLEVGILPILCVGETQNEREDGLTEDIILSQLRSGLMGLSGADVKRMVIAYEPIWAIGTGLTATSNQAEAVIKMIRGQVKAAYDQEVAGDLRILYGGSVKPENIDELMAEDNIDGALVGGASLKAETFARIIGFTGAK